jgi:hypothetical protein
MRLLFTFLLFLIGAVLPAQQNGAPLALAVDTGVSTGTLTAASGATTAFDLSTLPALSDGAAAFSRFPGAIVLYRVHVATDGSITDARTMIGFSDSGSGFAGATAATTGAVVDEGSTLYLYPTGRYLHVRNLTSGSVEVNITRVVVVPQ